MTATLTSEARLPERLAGPVLDLLDEAGRWPRIRMSGASMRPFIEPGDELLVEARPEHLRLGDVVLYRHEGRFVAHRVVAWRGSGQEPLLVLKGDRACGFDPPVSRQRICGRVVKKTGPKGTTDLASGIRRICNRFLALASGASGVGYELCHALLSRMRRR